MRIDEGKLRAYLDRALSLQEMEQVKTQLAGSPEARVILARLSQERDDFAQLLAPLAPPPGNRSAAPQALRRVQTQITGQSNPSKNIDLRERISTMFNKSFIKRYQPAIAIFTVVAITAILFSFAPVRTMAASLLKIFRVQTVQIVPVDEDHMEAMKNNPEIKGLIEELEPEIKVLTDSEPQKVDSLAEAAELVNFDIAEITALPEGLGDPSSIMVHKQRVVQMNLDKDLLEAIFEAAEIEISLPDSLDEEPIVVTQPDTVIQKWQQDGKNVLEFVQMASPAIEYPDDLDLNALGVAGLQLLGMSKDEAEALAKTIDWANTLILPVPKNGQVSVTEISINGAKGFLFAEKDSDDEAAVMWQNNGMSYFVNGDYAAEQMVEVAKSVK
jgi:anti-sigma factor RsiW